MNIIDKINQEQMKKDVTAFNVGDSVRVHTIVKEGEKERVQIFTGIVIGRKGTLLNASLTVRRISYGEGVERVFPIHSPRIAKIEVETAGTARRAKLNYLRNRKGKSAMAVREKALTVPEQSVVLRPAGKVVYVLGEKDGRLVAQQRDVETGVRQDGFYEIVKGLAPGDRIAVDGAGFLTNNAVVALPKPRPEAGKGSKKGEGGTKEAGKKA